MAYDNNSLHPKQIYHIITKIHNILQSKNYQNLIIFLVLNSFSQFLLDIEWSKIHDFVYNIGFVTLAKTNSSLRK